MFHKDTIKVTGLKKKTKKTYSSQPSRGEVVSKQGHALESSPSDLDGDLLHLFMALFESVYLPLFISNCVHYGKNECAFIP